MLKCSPVDIGPVAEWRPMPRMPPRQVWRQSTEPTECNYLVMFFVLGVFAMAIFDGLRK